ncbi:DMT family transporter [Roseospira marina]|nr:DMT family transporter [Roseospira marina]
MRSASLSGRAEEGTRYSNRLHTNVRRIRCAFLAKGQPVPPAVASWWRALSGNARGSLFMLLSAFCFSVMNGMIKMAGMELHTFQIVFFRCLFGLMALLPFIRREGLAIYCTRRPGLHALRVAIGILAMFCLFQAITHMDLATAVSITYARPMFMILLAILILGEVVRWRRGLATAVGFAGVLIVMRPDTAALDLNALTALASAALVATAMTLVKLLSRTERPLTILMWFVTGAVVITLGPALWVWQWPEPLTWVVLVAIGGTASLGQFLAVSAYREGEATLVTPFDYSQIVWATLIGILAFGELPDVWTFVGAGIIIVSALYILYREAQLGRVAAQNDGALPAPGTHVVSDPERRR